MKDRNYIMRVVNRFIKWVSPSANEELEVMENWKKEYMDEINVIGELQKNKSLSEKYSTFRDYNPDKAWSQMENKIKAEKKHNVFNLSKSPQVWKWAAIFIFITLSIWVVQISLVTSEVSKQYVAKSEILEFILDDNSKVTLDSSSVLVQNGFRKMELTGRALFDVSKDPENIFEIRTSNASIQVLGTSFMVTTRQNYTDIFVIGGKVSVSSGNEKVELSAGQSVVVENNSFRYSSGNKGVFTDWKKNILTFDNVELIEVLNTVARHYNVVLILPDILPDLSCTINTKFKDATLEYIMHELSLIARIKFSLRNKTLIIEQIQC